MRKSMIFIPGLIAISSLILLSGCDHSSNRNPIDKQDTPEDITDSVYKGSVFSLPAPMQIANQLRQFNPSYYVSYLVPPTGDAAKASCSAEDLAMILGILSVDLGYSVVYERQQAVLNYTAKVKKISDELGILGAFSPEVVQRIEANVNNIDSLVPVVLSSFNDVNEYFNDNDRQETGMLVLAGGMIEGLYISCQVALDMKDSLSRQVVGRQKFFLDNAIRAIGMDDNDSTITALIKHLNGLQEEYDKIEIICMKNPETPDRKAVEQIRIDDGHVVAIADKVTALRKEILE